MKRKRKRFFARRLTAKQKSVRHVHYNPNRRMKRLKVRLERQLRRGYLLDKLFAVQEKHGKVWRSVAFAGTAENAKHYARMHSKTVTVPVRVFISR